MTYAKDERRPPASNHVTVHVGDDVVVFDAGAEPPLVLDVPPPPHDQVVEALTSRELAAITEDLDAAITFAAICRTESVTITASLARRLSAALTQK